MSENDNITIMSWDRYKFDANAYSTHTRHQKFGDLKTT